MAKVNDILNKYGVKRESGRAQVDTILGKYGVTPSSMSTPRQTQPKSTFSPAGVLLKAPPAEGRVLLGYTKPVTLAEKSSAATGTEKKVVSQIAPYAMGRDSFTPASPYAAGLQAKEASETPEVTQPDTALPTFPQRVMDTISGGLKGTVASMTNMVGTLREMGQKSRDKENQAIIDNYARELEEAQAWLNAALEDVAKDPNLDAGRYPIILRCAGLRPAEV